MSSLFPDRPSSSPGRSPSRRFAPRPKASAEEPPPLPSGWVLAHCDGGARGNPGPAGFGAVVVDDAGQPLAELSEFLGFRTNNFAEYSGLLAVLGWALEQGHPRLRVISDSELMVKQIQGRYKVNSPDLRPLFEEARRRIARLESFDIHHALRHKNKTADRLANEAMDRGMGKPAAVPAATPYPRATAPSGSGARPDQRAEPPALAASPAARPVTSLRGFVRDGVVHLLEGKQLPENSFVKILPE